MHRERCIGGFEELAAINVANPVILFDASTHQRIATELSGSPLFGQGMIDAMALHNRRLEPFAKSTFGFHV